MTMQPTSMTQEQMEQFLAVPRNAVMGAIRKEGSPQLSAIWFIFREGKLYTTVYNSSAKYFNIRRDPRVVVCVNAAHPDARSVTLFGTAELIDSQSELFAKLDHAIAHHYHDTVEEARAYMEIADNADSSLVVFTPNKFIGQDYN
jgi:PPOX class probable F420-dependent enzyme